MDNEKVRNMCIKVDRELSAIVEDFSGNWEAGEAAEVLQDRAAAVAARRHGYHENPVNDDTALAPLREKLLGNLKGIAGREASRLVANLSVRLTPEMAMAVFQNLTLQVRAMEADRAMVRYAAGLIDVVGWSSGGLVCSLGGRVG